MPAWKHWERGGNHEFVEKTADGRKMKVNFNFFKICCDWHYYKVEIQYESFGDHHSVVIKCAGKEFGIIAKFPLCPKDFSVGTTTRSKFNTSLSVTTLV